MVLLTTIKQFTIMESVRNAKGFKVLKFSNYEAHLMGWGCGDEIICCECNGLITGDVYYIPALYDVMDEECYKEFIRTAKHYEDDYSIRSEKEEFHRVKEEFFQRLARTITIINAY
jgi:hypothetical protein